MELTKPIIHVKAPSRLHFGLLSFADDRKYGGCGVMVDEPGVTISFEPASEFNASGSHAQRVTEFASRWAEFHQRRELPAVRVYVSNAPPQHVGLGVGTQLALAVAAGLNATSDISATSPLDLSQSVGRGLRSAVGVYGFHGGGFIVERGKKSGEPLSPLDCQIALPDDWRLVLVRPNLPPGASGVYEQQAFANMKIPSQSHLKALEDVLRNQLTPAAVQGDATAFGEAVTQYGKLSGRMFAEIQGGDYNGPVLTDWVSRLLNAGALGAGQSSWGPTLFALAADSLSAESLVNRLGADDQTHVVVSKICNTGAVLSRH